MSAKGGSAAAAAATFTPAKATTPAAQPNLSRGTKVKVHGIQEPAINHFNGKLVTIHSYQVLGNAYKVTLDDGASQCFPEANLQEVQAPAPAPTPVPAPAPVPVPVPAPAPAPAPAP